MENNNSKTSDSSTTPKAGNLNVAQAARSGQDAEKATQKATQQSNGSKEANTQSLSDIQGTAKDADKNQAGKSTDQLPVPTAQPQKDFADGLHDSAEKFDTAVKEFIGKNPMASVLITVGAGFAANFIMKAITNSSSSKTQQSKEAN